MNKVDLTAHSAGYFLGFKVVLDSILGSALLQFLYRVALNRFIKIFTVLNFILQVGALVKFYVVGIGKTFDCRVFSNTLPSQ